MAKQKFDTIEEVVAATGIELTDKTRPFLESFVKKAAGTGGDAAAAKKKDLLEKAALFGVAGLNADAENVSTILVKTLTFLFEQGRHDEMKEFAAANNLYVTDDGHIHRVRQSVKPIEQRNAGVKEGSVGANTILLLKNLEYANLTAAELASKLAEDYGQTTTPACVQWYINYCNKKKAAAEVQLKSAEEAGTDTTAILAEIERYTIAPRQRAARSNKAAETGVVLGAELTLEKAQKPKGFQKKAVEGSAAATDAAGEPGSLGEEMQLEA